MVERVWRDYEVDVVEAGYHGGCRMDVRWFCLGGELEMVMGWCKTWRGGMG